MFLHVRQTQMPNVLQPTLSVKLTLSDDAAVESVLRDIPFFAVGLLAFGISTFFLVMKRVTLLVIYLYTSALLAFGAAILDLSQLLAQSPNTVDNTIDSAGISGLINTREVGFSLSVGFRFLFFWTLVAERPRGEPPPPPIDDRQPGYTPRLHSHSADWQRWGYLGVILKWSLLALTISIPITQIIWRVTQKPFSTVYMVESTIEIVVSALFILKIMLNVFLSPLTPWWRPLQYYIAPLVGLLLNLGIAVGNLVFSQFSETTLGRFLQAVELYVLILYILIATFYEKRRIDRSRRIKGTSSFAGLREQPSSSTLPDNQNAGDEKPQVMVIGRTYSPVNEGPRARRDSSLSRIGSWILKPTPRTVSTQSQVLRVDPGRGLPPDALQTPRIPQVDAGRDRRNEINEIRQGRRLEDSREEDNRQERVLPIQVSVPSSQLSPAPPLQVPPTPLSPSPPRSAAKLPTTQSQTTGMTDMDFSYYGIDGPSLIPNPFVNRRFSDNGSESPVYGLNGIIRDDNRLSKVSTLPSRASMSSLDELLRQQTELDKSIAALRLFSPETALIFPETPANVPLERLRPQSNRIVSSSTNSYNGQRVDSASGRSEFSLSNFPEPPTANTAPRYQRERGSGRVSRIPNEDLPSIPSSPSQISAPQARNGARLDSAGTQYEITSFIGDLMAPNSGPYIPQTQKRFSTFTKGLSDVESEDETSPVIVTSSSAPTVRPIVLGSAIPSVTSVPSMTPATASNGYNTGVTGNNNRETNTTVTQPSSRPFVLRGMNAGNSDASAGSSRAPGLVPIGPRTRARSSSLTTATAAQRTRLIISGPRPQAPDGKGEQAPGAFERPRPPPLILADKADKFL